ncbi:hypothetical protein ACLK1T_13275 [Escherichia coli]
MISLGGGFPHDCAKVLRWWQPMVVISVIMKALTALQTAAADDRHQYHCGYSIRNDCFCIITDEARHIKMAIVDKHVTPLLSVNDSSPTIFLCRSH